MSLEFKESKRRAAKGQPQQWKQTTPESWVPHDLQSLYPHFLVGKVGQLHIHFRAMKNKTQNKVLGPCEVEELDSGTKVRSLESSKR